MKKLIATTLFLFAFIALRAQDPFFTLFRQNDLWLNPASAGTEDKHVFSLSGRTQWQQTFNTVVLTYDQPLKKINSGVGAVGWYEQDGDAPIRTYYVGLCYDYQVKLTDKMKLGIGLEAAFAHQTIDFENLTFATQFNGTGFSSTPISNESSISNNYLDFNAGLWYKWSEFYVGASIKHIVTPSINSESGNSYEIDKNIILTSGYTWKFSKHFSMIPSILYMHQNMDNFFEVNDEFSFNDTYFLGGGVRTTSDINPLIVCGGINWNKKIQVMLSYDFTSSIIQNFPAKYWRDYEANIKYRF